MKATLSQQVSILDQLTEKLKQTRRTASAEVLWQKAKASEQLGSLCDTLESIVAKCRTQLDLGLEEAEAEYFTPCFLAQPLSLYFF